MNLDVITMINIGLGMVNAILILLLPITSFIKAWGAIGWICAVLANFSYLIK